MEEEWERTEELEGKVYGGGLLGPPVCAVALPDIIC